MKEEPEAVLIFGTPAQIGRLIQAVTYFGGAVKANLTAKTASCAEALFPALNGEVAIAVPGAGDRVFAAIQESEMIFAMPYGWTDKIIEGLEKGGGERQLPTLALPDVLTPLPQAIQGDSGEVQTRLRAVITP